MKALPQPIAIYLISLFTSVGVAQVETFDIPKLESIQIDGSFDDWGDKVGFGVEVLLPEAGDFKKADDHNVSFRLGWNEEGLLIYIEVEDDSWIEYPEKGKYYSADVVEVFLAQQRGDEDVCQWYITPGMTGAVPEPGVRFRELRRGPTRGMASEMKVFRGKMNETSYRMELLAPWSSIGKIGEAGTKVAFQIWVNDKDAGDLRSRYMSIFYPAKGASYASGSMHNLRLVDQSRPSLRISSLGNYDTSSFQPFVRLWARAERSGKKVFVKKGEEEIGSAILNDSESPGRATAKIVIPPAPVGKPYEELGIFLEKQQVHSISLPYSDVIGSVKELYDQRETYRARFKLDEPWADLDDPLLDRHRGLAAAGLNLLEETPLPSREEDMEVLAKTIEMLSDIEKGADYFAKQRNGLWGYYYCKADGTGQRFSMTIPRDFDPAQRYPLYVNLHGNGGRPLPTKSKARQSDYFQVRPWGRGDISFFGLGEVDVLESIKHLVKWYPIDTDQICLGGHSMGGNATWDLASKYTNLFSCLVPKAGRSGDAYYENFRHLPALIQHGAKDGSQPVDFGRYTVSRLRQLGFEVIYKEFPEDGHGIRHPYPVEEWFVKQRRPRSPKVITYTCDSPASGEIYWATIRRFVDPHRSASIDAWVSADKDANQIDLKLTNIEVIELNLNDVPIDKSEPLRLKINGESIKINLLENERTTLILDQDTWGLTGKWHNPVSPVRLYSPGAAGNLYTGEPLLIVYPSQGKEEVRSLMEDSARNLVLYGGFGNEMITGRVPIKSDKEVTEEDLQHRNLILFGGPDYNLISRKVAGKLPVQINAANQFVVEGHPPIDVNESSLLLTYYNPIAPGRLIHLIWQDEIPEERRARFARFARNRLPGASGRHPHNIPDLQITSREQPFTIRRQFTHDWKLKVRMGVDIEQSPKVIEEGIDVTRLRLMKIKSRADYAVGQGMGSWRRADLKPPTLDQFRYRNFGFTTFVAKIRGKDLEKVFTGPSAKNLISYPAFREGGLEPERIYTITAPESILWNARSLRTFWTEMEAGPDLLKSDVVQEVYGVSE